MDLIRLNNYLDDTARRLAADKGGLSFTDGRELVVSFIDAGQQGDLSLAHLRISEEDLEGEVRRSDLALSRLRSLGLSEACTTLASAGSVIDQTANQDVFGVVLAGLVLWAVVRDLAHETISGPEVVSVIVLAKQQGGSMPVEEYCEQVSAACAARSISIAPDGVRKVVDKLARLKIVEWNDDGYRLTEKPIFQ